MSDIPNVEVAGEWIISLYKRYKKAVTKIGYDCDWEIFKQIIEDMVREAEEEVDS